MNNQSESIFSTRLIMFCLSIIGLSVMSGHLLASGAQSLMPGVEIDYNKNLIIFSIVSFFSILIALFNILPRVMSSEETSKNNSKVNLTKDEKTKNLLTLIEENSSFDSQPSKWYLLTAGLILATIISTIIYFVSKM